MRVQVPPPAPHQPVGAPTGYGEHRGPLPQILTKIRARVAIDPETGCWLWQLSTGSNGYAQMRLGSQTRRVHRLAFELWHGWEPVGLDVHHLCARRRCVNPEHLEAITHRENLLRSASTVTARNAARLRCGQGHAFDQANTYRDRRGSRRCRACNRERARRRAERERAADPGQGRGSTGMLGTASDQRSRNRHRRPAEPGASDAAP